MVNRCSLIQKRDIDPLLSRAGKILKSYAEAAGRAVSVLDQRGRSIMTTPAAETRRRGFPPGDGTRELFFSGLCKKHCCSAGVNDEYPCSGHRVDAVFESHRLGGSYIYTCPLGFIFWASPIYSGGYRAGTLLS